MIISTYRGPFQFVRMYRWSRGSELDTNIFPAVQACPGSTRSDRTFRSSDRKARSLTSVFCEILIVI